MDWMFLSPQNSYVETLIPNGMVFGSRAFSRESDLDGDMKLEPSWWHSCPYKERKKPELSLFPPWKDTGRWWPAICKPARGSAQNLTNWHPDCRIATSRTEKINLCWVSHLSLLFYYSCPRWVRHSFYFLIGTTCKSLEIWLLLLSRDYCLSSPHHVPSGPSILKSSQLSMSHALPEALLKMQILVQYVSMGA